MAVVSRFLCLLHSSNLLTEPVCLNDLKTEFLLFIALSNDGESQARCFLREVILGIQISIISRNLFFQVDNIQPIHVGCIGEH